MQTDIDAPSTSGAFGQRALKALKFASASSTKRVGALFKRAPKPQPPSSMELMEMRGPSSASHRKTASEMSSSTEASSFESDQSI